MIGPERAEACIDIVLQLQMLYDGIGASDCDTNSWCDRQRPQLIGCGVRAGTAMRSPLVTAAYEGERALVAADQSKRAQP